MFVHYLKGTEMQKHKIEKLYLLTTNLAVSGNQNKWEKLFFDTQDADVWKDHQNLFFVNCCIENDQ